MRKLIEKVCLRLEKWCEKTGRVLLITSRQAEDDVYLIRYFVFRSKYLSVYIHRFMRSDQDDPHDHPFDFLSYVISGGYKEVIYDCEPLQPRLGTYFLDDRAGARWPGTWAYRRAETIHKVLVDKPRKLTEKLDAPFTIIFRGPERREWQFWKLGGHFYDDDGTSTRYAEPMLWYKYLGVEDHSRE